MTNFETITSAQNTKVKQIKKLRERRGRDREGLFVIDDNRDLERALAWGFQVDYAFYCPTLGQVDDMLLAKVSPVYQVDKSIMEKASYRQNPSSLMAVMRQKPRRDAERLYQLTDTHILALVNLQKPGNIGALLRTADATGFRTIFLIDTALDIYNPNIIRSSTGACFLDNIYTLTTQEALTFFTDYEYAIIAAVVAGDVDLHDADFTDKSAIVLGTEDNGLDDVWIAQADQQVRIPMVGQLSDSLNVSVSGAIFMYEALRQRF